MLVAVLTLALLCIFSSPDTPGFIKYMLGLNEAEINGTGINKNSKETAVTILGGGIVILLAAINAVAVYQRTGAQIDHNILVEKGHVQDRFKAAVEHLGSAQIIIRIAAFREFHYLARDNEELRADIFDILCDYLRHTTKAGNYSGNNGSPTAEVQKLLDILFKPQDEKYIFAEFSADLRDVVLNSANLRDACMKGAKFGMHISDIDFTRADLQKANFRDCDLTTVILHYARMQNADLSNSLISGSFLCAKMQLQGTKLINAHWAGTDLTSAQLQGADLTGADLHGAILQHAQLQSATLSNVKFGQANLESAKLHGAFMGGADFRCAKLNSAGFQGTDCNANFGEGIRIVRICPKTNNDIILHNTFFFGGISEKEAAETEKILSDYGKGSTVARYKNAVRGDIGRAAEKGLYSDNEAHAEKIEIIRESSSK